MGVRLSWRCWQSPLICKFKKKPKITEDPLWARRRPRRVWMCFGRTPLRISPSQHSSFGFILWISPCVLEFGLVAPYFGFHLFRTPPLDFSFGFHLFRIPTLHFSLLRSPLLVFYLLYLIYLTYIIYLVDLQVPPGPP